MENFNLISEKTITVSENFEFYFIFTERNSILSHPLC